MFQNFGVLFSYCNEYIDNLNRKYKHKLEQLQARASTKNSDSMRIEDFIRACV